MKLPDFRDYDEAGVLEYHGHADAVEAAASHAKLRYLNVDLSHADDKATLFDALASGLALPDHFGNNFDALADSLEDRDWLGKRGCADPPRPCDALPQDASERLAHARGDLLRSVDVLARAAPAVLGARRADARANRALRERRLQAAGLGARHRAYGGTARAAARARRFSRALAIGHRQPRRGRGPCRHGAARAARGNGHRRRRVRRTRRLAPRAAIRDLSAMAASLSAGHDAQHRARVLARRRACRCRSRFRAREHRAPCLAAVAGGRRPLLLVVESRRHPRAARARARDERQATKAEPHAHATARMAASHRAGRAASLHVRIAFASPPTSARRPRAQTTLIEVRRAAAGHHDHRVGVRATSPTTACTRSLRAEADNADAAQAASDVNARMARALSRARAVAGVERRRRATARTRSRSRNRPMRWRVSQTLALESGDFVALSALVSKLQGSDGLLLSGLDFSREPAARGAPPRTR